MKFEARPGWEYVRPSDRAGGYWRKKSERIPSVLQKECRERFKERALKTRGVKGTIELKDGRIISRTAFEIAKNASESNNNEGQGQPVQTITAPWHIEPAQNNEPINQREGSSQGKHDIDMIEILQAKMISDGVRRGEIPRDVGILWFLERLKMK